MNNRKQQINSFLNSLTTKELDTYLKENKINKNHVEELEILTKYRQYKHTESHFQKLYNKTYNSINNLYFLGEANIIATILYYSLQESFDIKDFVKMFNKLLENNKELKEYVYEIMKDFN